MKTLSLIQGSKEWHDHRATHFNASDAPAMMGVSPYKTRDQLLKEIATGDIPEVDSYTQKIFDDGHRFEALARPLAEDIIGEELFPVIGVEGTLSASFDGLTMMEDIAFEHKSLNDKIRAAKTAKSLPDYLRIQMEQQLAVSGAEKCLFMATKWGDNDDLVEKKELWYKPDLKLRKKIIDGWEQFRIDLEAYEHVAEVVKPVVADMMELPALNIQINGQVKDSNLVVYQAKAMDFIKAINTDLKTDEDFAVAEKTIKFCGASETKLDLVKQQALSQTADIEELFNTIDNLKSEMRTKRLTLEKLVKTQKENIKAEILQNAFDAMKAYLITVQASLGGDYLPDIPESFSEAMKGKKTVASLQAAANDELARVKIEVSEIADLIRVNLKAVDDVEEYRFLFNDMRNIITKPNDDFEMLLAHRVSIHKSAEAEKLADEREKIRREEEAKAANENARIAEAQQAVERAEREKAETAAKAVRDKEEAEQRAIRAAEQAKQDQIDAVERERKAAEQREEARIAAEEAAKAEEAAEAKRREKNKAHKASINNAALQCFVDGGMTDIAAKLAVKLIAGKKIENVTISY